MRIFSYVKPKNSNSEGVVGNEPCSSVVSETPPPKRTKCNSIAKVRKWDDTYLRYGFFLPDDQLLNVAPQPECLIFYNRLSNSAVVPAKLQRHLETNHSVYATKTISFFKHMKSCVHKQKVSFLGAVKTNPEGGQKDLRNNYRPISLLSPMNNIFKKLLYSRLYSYIEQHNMLSTNQYGFRSGLSTSLAVYDIHENFLQNKEKGLSTCAVFCDLSKAFDTLDHEILLWKLEHFYGIRGLPHKLLTSYLQDRQQCTVVGGYTSTTRGVTLGVPQGSSLGPSISA